MHSDRSHHSVGLPHSEIRGSQPSYRLLSAYRRFLRPSSPLNAKASIMCPLRLGHAYLAPSSDPCGCLGETGHATSDLHAPTAAHASDFSHVRAARCISRSFSVHTLQLLSSAVRRTLAEPASDDDPGHATIASLVKEPEPAGLVRDRE